MAHGAIGFIDTPKQGNRRPSGVLWCADNGCFSERWEPEEWWRFLVANASDASSCLFATAPDVVGDAAAMVCVLLIAVPVAVGLSRLYRGAHFPSDVLFGAVLGAVWLAFVIRTLMPAEADAAARR